MILYFYLFLNSVYNSKLNISIQSNDSLFNNKININNKINWNNNIDLALINNDQALIYNINNFNKKINLYQIKI